MKIKHGFKKVESELGPESCSGMTVSNGEELTEETEYSLVVIHVLKAPYNQLINGVTGKLACEDTEREMIIKMNYERSLQFYVKKENHCQFVDDPVWVLR